MRIGARVSSALRQRVSWFAYRCSSAAVSWAISDRLSSVMGDPGTVVLLGQHVTEPGLQDGPFRAARPWVLADAIAVSSLRR
jgi:hypothetical protein